jgi:ribosomal protein L3 glutamine methyltransferase
VHSILDVGTGSGCIAIACALAFPTAKVVATDISADALQVAQKNIERHAVGLRLELQETNLMDGLQGPFDVIISNPPYVPDGEQRQLPAEYAHEPALGLFSGTDGLDSARQILQDAPRLLTESGILVLEVGAQWSALEQAFPKLGFTWLEFEYGGEGVAVLSKAELANL